MTRPKLQNPVQGVIARDRAYHWKILRRRRRSIAGKTDTLDSGRGRQMRQAVKVAQFLPATTRFSIGDTVPLRQNAMPMEGAERAGLLYDITASSDGCAVDKLASNGVAQWRKSTFHSAWRAWIKSADDAAVPFLAPTRFLSTSALAGPGAMARPAICSLGGSASWLWIDTGMTPQRASTT